MSNVLEVDIPREFTKGLVDRFGRGAEEWLESVPRLLSNRLRAWNLSLEDCPVLHGAMGLIFFVRKGEDRLVLKLSWLDDLTESENKALKIWNGEGAVKLVDYDSKTHASLMERLNRESLNDIDIVNAGVEAGKLIRKLGVRVEGGFPRLDNRLQDLRFDLDKRRLKSGGNDFDWELVQELISRRKNDIDSLLSHGDIGYSNVLRASDGSWKAIDPKPMLGDLEFSVPELMWNRIDELSNDEQVLAHLNRVVNAGKLNRGKAIDWAIIRAVDYYFWGVEHGLTDDPPRCMRLYRILSKEVA